jgi:transketolase
MAYVLWQRHLRHNPANPSWMDRDRFVLSAGHGSMLLYCLLHLTGYDVTMEDLKSFRQWGSRTPGHPEYRLTPGVEATTGPLGQGTANAVGMAIAERALAHAFNRPGHTIVDHRTFALVSDGDIMEGISHEAASLAGHLKLGKLVYLYDSNHVTLDGPASLSFSEDVGKRYEAYGWKVLHVRRGDTDLEEIDAAIKAAVSQQERPTLIVVNTSIGYGSPKAGTSKVHGSPLNAEEVAATKKTLGWEWQEPFTVPEDARRALLRAREEGKTLEAKWRERFAAYEREHPALAAEWNRRVAGRLPEGWDSALPTWKAGEKVATRVAAGKALNAVALTLPELMGGDADLSESTKTTIEKGGDFDGQTGAGRNIHFGVREHAMGGIVNGIAYHGGLRPFGATFFNFLDYMKPSVRLAALSELPAIFVWTHDSIGLGEDGPTHQPVEQLMTLRATPHTTVIRPCDANEAAEAWRVAASHAGGPVGIVLTRQNLPVLDRAKFAPASMLAKGAYVLAEASGKAPRVILIATGSEVSLAMEAREALEAASIATRVVSMPSWELFAKQPASYRDEVLPPKIRARVSIEAGSSVGWERWVGLDGVAIGLERFGASAPGDVVMKELGFNVDHVVATARKLVS